MFKLILYLAIISINLINGGLGSHLCTGLRSNINITQYNSGPLLTYNLDVAFKAESNGFESMTVTDTKLWAINSSFTASDLTFYSQVQAKEYDCGSDIGNCILKFVDGDGLLELYIKDENHLSKLLILDDMTYFKGTVFWNDGMVLTPDHPCLYGKEWGNGFLS